MNDPDDLYVALRAAQDERDRLEALAEVRDLTDDEVVRLREVLRYLVHNRHLAGDQSLLDL